MSLRYYFSPIRLAKIQNFNIIFYCKPMEKQALSFMAGRQMSTSLLESK